MGCCGSVSTCVIFTSCCTLCCITIADNFKIDACCCLESKSKQKEIELTSKEKVV